MSQTSRKKGPRWRGVEWEDQEWQIEKIRSQEDRSSSLDQDVFHKWWFLQSMFIKKFSIIYTIFRTKTVKVSRELRQTMLAKEHKIPQTSCLRTKNYNPRGRVGSSETATLPLLRRSWPTGYPGFSGGWGLLQSHTIRQGVTGIFKAKTQNGCRWAGTRDRSG